VKKIVLTTTNVYRSTSKASYLAHRRDRDRSLPNFEGSYKRTMSPSGQENNTASDKCERVPSAVMPAEEEQQQQRPPSQHTEAVSNEKKFVVLTSVIDCNCNKETNSRTSNEVEITTEEIECKIRHSPSAEVIVVPPVTVNNTETETQCDIAESTADTQSKAEDPSPSVESCSPPQSPPPPPPTLQQIVSPPPVTESLQLVQRSEVVLRVNAATSDAASQTESERDILDSKTDVVVSLPFVRQKLQEEIECERLSLDLASHLPASDKLQGLLVPAPEHKKPTDYVSGLFRNVTPRPRSTKSESSVTKSVSTVTTTTATSNDNIPSMKENGQNSEEVKENDESTVSPLSASSAYFTTSESKAKFLTRYGRDMNQSEQLNGLQDNKDLQKKKEELMARLDRKLQVLRGEHLVVTEESKVNDELGETVAAQVSRLARPHEASKYRLHVEEVGKITSLLLGLSGRLARAENALMDLPNHHSERKILESKRDKLKEQLEEAKKLKENIDRRSVCVSNILYKYFNAEEYADYDHFINMKAKLIMDSREIADKIKLGEEQLAALKETLTAPD
ncbi:hypothetical protein L9F63_019817, partial [Diploptera punctata]